MKFACSHCGQHIEVRNSYAGQMVACPTCEEEVRIPEASELGGDADVDPGREGEGTVIGNFTLLKKIGEGGFGVVYLAEQRKPVRRRVAIKIVKPGMDSKEVIARFESERQALAFMDHPNIAHVYDAGILDSNRPYFVMEYVDGVAITDFCDEKRLSIGSRLKLFVDVCKAIQHAHQKGVVHRDIKPSNVIVSVQSEKAVPKVIDFGVAKAMNQDLTDMTVNTISGQMMGTPAYMSPEQAEGLLDVDTRTDVYALGVLLYELLTGATPIALEKLRQAGLLGMGQLIKEEIPLKPSSRITTLGEGGVEVAKNRAVEPSRLGKIVRGELDWIVMKALEKDRARRYDAPNSLVFDIQRFLSGETVLASPPSQLYRFRKFVVRNRMALGAAALIFLMALAGTVISTWQASIASRERRNAQHEAAQALEAKGIADRESLRAREAEARARRETDRAREAEKLAVDRLAEIEKQKSAVTTVTRLADDLKIRVGEAAEALEKEARASEAAIAVAVDQFDSICRALEERQSKFPGSISAEDQLDVMQALDIAAKTFDAAKQEGSLSPLTMRAAELLIPIIGVEHRHSMQLLTMAFDEKYVAGDFRVAEIIAERVKEFLEAYGSSDMQWRQRWSELLNAAQSGAGNEGEEVVEGELLAVKAEEDWIDAIFDKAIKPPVRGEFRVWTNLAGRKTEGKLEEVNSDTIEVRVANGTLYSISIDQLNPVDQGYIERWLELPAPRAGLVRFFGAEADVDRVVFVIESSSSLVQSIDTQLKRHALLRKELGRTVEKLADGHEFQIIFFGGPCWVAGGDYRSEARHWEKGVDGDYWVYDDGRGTPFPLVEFVGGAREEIRSTLLRLKDVPIPEGRDWRNPLKMAIAMEPDAVFFLTSGTAAKGPQRASAVKEILGFHEEHDGVKIHSIGLMVPKGEEEAVARDLKEIAGKTGGTFRMVLENEEVVSIEQWDAYLRERDE